MEHAPHILFGSRLLLLITTPGRKKKKKKKKNLTNWFHVHFRVKELVPLIMTFSIFQNGDMKLTCDAGDADLDLPTLDPFHFDLDELRFQQWNIYGSAKARNTTSTGNKDMAVRSVRANLKDPTRFEMEVDVFHPQILIRGERRACDMEAAGRVGGALHEGDAVRALVPHRQPVHVRQRLGLRQQGPQPGRAALHQQPMGGDRAQDQPRLGQGLQQLHAALGQQSLPQGALRPTLSSRGASKHRRRERDFI
ncbi:hypothetical protein C0J52_00605 [Blattella germanica]|nr:hypothetical protein C0J52_00605 [Blattella germanica]